MAPEEETGVWRFLQRCKTEPKLWIPIMLANVAGMVGGYYYYWDVGQFRRGSPYYEPMGWWAFVSDSPNAVVLMSVVMLLMLFNKRSAILDSLALLHMVYVGLWTTFLFLSYPEEFGTFEWGSTNSILFITHMGMPLEALILLPDLRRDFIAKWLPAALAGWAALNMWLDYGPIGLRPAPFLDAGPLLMRGSIALMIAAFALVLYAQWPGLTGRASKGTLRR